ncbi:CinA family protein [Segnochrobactrum spirostomi]|uniref:CinA family protein n=1 Tax=Segnochrobactrum spirostomi TaxID=2608987 RepID=A0A6A7Y4H8_9HYPH|nr:CinA family protein [Segnochrobactrum spirostomi]MQT14044.1 CinA family protein [Segnochrobactrum spirostomi]
MSDRQALEAAAADLLARARAAGLTIATAESCTGGLIAGTLTEIAGSSAVVDRGFVTYSNAAKTEMLGVDADLIESRGAVSREVALAMVEGVFAMSPVDLAVAVTGIAGPGGGSAEKPVGLVHLAAGRRGHDPVHIERRFGDIGRAGVRTATIAAAFELVASLLPR